MTIDLKNSVCVFDLDDTLYLEIDYVHSGIQHVKDLCLRLGLIEVCQVGQKFEPNIKAGTVISDLRQHLKLPITIEPTLLWAYRLHQPNIKLEQAVDETIEWARRSCKAVAILTNGRSITQRLKIAALGLSAMPVFISEEYGEEKPSPTMYKAVEKSWPGCGYIYVGDNPEKDFVAANDLGWKTVCVSDKGSNIHPQQCNSNLNLRFTPQITINSLADLPACLNAA